MKINLSQQISRMTLTEDAEEGMDVTSITDYLQKNEKVAEYVSWVILAYKKDKMEVLKKMVEMFKKEGFGSIDGAADMSAEVSPEVDTTPEAPAEEPAAEPAPEEAPAEEQA